MGCQKSVYSAQICRTCRENRCDGSIAIGVINQNERRQLNIALDEQFQKVAKLKDKLSASEASLIDVYICAVKLIGSLFW